MRRVLPFSVALALCISTFGCAAESSDDASASGTESELVSASIAGVWYSPANKHAIAIENEPGTRRTFFYATDGRTETGSAGELASPGLLLGRMTRLDFLQPKDLWGHAPEPGPELRTSYGAVANGSTLGLALWSTHPAWAGDLAGSYLRFDAPSDISAICGRYKNDRSGTELLVTASRTGAWFYELSFGTTTISGAASLEDGGRRLHLTTPNGDTSIRIGFRQGQLVLVDGRLAPWSLDGEGSEVFPQAASPMGHYVAVSYADCGG